MIDYEALVGLIADLARQAGSGRALAEKVPELVQRAEAAEARVAELEQAPEPSTDGSSR